MFICGGSTGNGMNKLYSIAIIRSVQKDDNILLRTLIVLMKMSVLIILNIMLHCNYNAALNNEILWLSVRKIYGKCEGRNHWEMSEQRRLRELLNENQSQSN